MIILSLLFCNFLYAQSDFTDPRFCALANAVLGDCAGLPVEFMTQDAMITKGANNRGNFGISLTDFKGWLKNPKQKALLEKEGDLTSLIVLGRIQNLNTYVKNKMQKQEDFYGYFNKNNLIPYSDDSEIGFLTTQFILKFFNKINQYEPSFLSDRCLDVIAAIEFQYANNIVKQESLLLRSAEKEVPFYQFAKNLYDAGIELSLETLFLIPFFQNDNKIPGIVSQNIVSKRQDGLIESRLPDLSKDRQGMIGCGAIMGLATIVPTFVGLGNEALFNKIVQIAVGVFSTHPVTVAAGMTYAQVGRWIYENRASINNAEMIKNATIEYLHKNLNQQLPENKVISYFGNSGELKRDIKDPLLDTPILQRGDPKLNQNDRINYFGFYDPAFYIEDAYEIGVQVAKLIVEQKITTIDALHEALLDENNCISQLHWAVCGFYVGGTSLTILPMVVYLQAAIEKQPHLWPALTVLNGGDQDTWGTMAASLLGLVKGEASVLEENKDKFDQLEGFKTFREKLVEPFWKNPESVAFKVKVEEPVEPKKKVDSRVVEEESSLGASANFTTTDPDRQQIPETNKSTSDAGTKGFARPLSPSIDLSFGQIHEIDGSKLQVEIKHTIAVKAGAESDKKGRIGLGSDPHRKKLERSTSFQKKKLSVGGDSNEKRSRSLSYGAKESGEKKLYKGMFLSEKTLFEYENSGLVNPASVGNPTPTPQPPAVNPASVGNPTPTPQPPAVNPTSGITPVPVADPTPTTTPAGKNFIPVGGKDPKKNPKPFWSRVPSFIKIGVPVVGLAGGLGSLLYYKWNAILHFITQFKFARLWQHTV